MCFKLIRTLRFLVKGKVHAVIGYSYPPLDSKTITALGWHKVAFFRDFMGSCGKLCSSNSKPYKLGHTQEELLFGEPADITDESLLLSPTKPNPPSFLGKKGRLMPQDLYLRLIKDYAINPTKSILRGNGATPQMP